jgi:hypothetical protein
LPAAEPNALHSPYWLVILTHRLDNAKTFFQRILNGGGAGMHGLAIPGGFLYNKR